MAGGKLKNQTERSVAKGDPKQHCSPASSPPPSPRPHHDSTSPNLGKKCREKDLTSGFPVTTPLIPDLPIYTWQEVAQHTTPQSCWMYIGNKVYDVTAWLDKHPGGQETLLMAAGRDCTDLFISYHPFTELPAKILAKYCIGQVITTEFPQYQVDTGFYAEVRREVGHYFREANLDDKDPLPGLLRLAGFMLVAIASWCLFVWSCTSGWPLLYQMGLAMLFGVVQALPFVHLMHDASHFAIGHNETWWMWIGRFVLDWFGGASMNSWHNQHVLGHHVYTNMLGVDPDLPMAKTGSFRRVCPQQKWTAAYAYQHLYLLVLYGFTALKFRIEDLTDLLIFKKVGPIRMNDIRNREVLSLMCSKIFFITWRYLMPVFYLGIHPGRMLALTILVEFIAGYFLNFSFQISHISPECQFTVGDDGPVPLEWAQCQLSTTLDYAHDSWLTTFLNGALNYQAIHHLFPSVSQYHYPAIAPIVQRVAKKYDIPYNYVGTFAEAFRLHLRHLYVLGVDKVLHSH